MINFLIGKPGDGKTMKAVRLMLEHLRVRDPRPLVSNIRLDSPSVVEWMMDNSPLAADYWFRRLRHQYFYIEEDKLREFFRYRGKLVLDAKDDLPVASFGKIKNGKEELFPDFGKVKDGVVYFLDEVHVPFGARNWQSNGPQCLYYLSQHRHFGDDIWCITQHPDQVAKEFRMLAQSYIQMRNRYRQKFKWFKMPPGFVELHFPDIPRRGDSVAYDRHVFPLDPAVGKCYDTTAGVGVGGSRAPELVKSKGIPIRSLWVMGAAVFLGVLIAARVGLGVLQDNVVATVRKPTAMQSMGAAVVGSVATAPATSSPSSPVKFVFLASDGRVFLSLADGRSVAASGSGYRVFLTGKNALVNGEIVELRRDGQ